MSLYTVVSVFFGYVKRRPDLGHEQPSFDDKSVMWHWHSDTVPQYPRFLPDVLYKQTNKHNVPSAGDIAMTHILEETALTSVVCENSKLPEVVENNNMKSVFRSFSHILLTSHRQIFPPEIKNYQATPSSTFYNPAALQLSLSVIYFVS